MNSILLNVANCRVIELLEWRWNEYQIKYRTRLFGNCQWTLYPPRNSIVRSNTGLLAVGVVDVLKNISVLYQVHPESWETWVHPVSKTRWATRWRHLLLGCSPTSFKNWALKIVRIFSHHITVLLWVNTDAVKLFLAAVGCSDGVLSLLDSAAVLVMICSARERGCVQYSAACSSTDQAGYQQRQPAAESIQSDRSPGRWLTECC